MDRFTKYIDLEHLKQFAHGRFGSSMALRVEYHVDKSECDRIYEELNFFAMAYPNVQLQQSYLGGPAPFVNKCMIMAYLDKKDN